VFSKIVSDSSYLLIIAIGVGDNLGDLGVLLGEQVLVVDQIGLVGVVRCSGLISIGDEWAIDNDQNTFITNFPETIELTQHRQ
jgi:hypothetical protein